VIYVGGAKSRLKAALHSHYPSLVQQTSQSKSSAQGGVTQQVN